MDLTEVNAEVILKMAYACYSEGIGPDYTELTNEIFALYPHLREKYKYL